MPQDVPEKKVFTPRESRQGVRGRPVLIILIVSLLLALGFWALAETWGEATAPPTTETQPAPGPATPSTPSDTGGQGTMGTPPPPNTTP